MRLTERTVEMLHGGERVASHALVAEPAKGRPRHVTCRGHLSARYHYREEWTKESLLARASKIGGRDRRFEEAALEDGPTL